MSDIRILHYAIKYQNANIVIIRFSKREISAFLKKSSVWIETGDDPNYFWECFEEALLEISGVLFVIVEGYEITVIKNFCLPNWGRIIEDVIWCSLFFLNPNGGAIEVKNGKNIGKLITHKFDAVEPEYPRKK
ncbi:MAG: hypothetical protein KGJ58_01645 [Patescibacteria group bacterium]|nr:hypothetical protein [Patescibacteria group bacterium]MDE1988499.1 hypothetical protein [Patescibacteria group bacterium]MDE2218142.1 hypothetical protein [Patescibacteria group bacterium]